MFFPVELNCHPSRNPLAAQGSLLFCSVLHKQLCSQLYKEREPYRNSNANFQSHCAHRLISPTPLSLIRKKQMPEKTERSAQAILKIPQIWVSVSIDQRETYNWITDKLTWFPWLWVSVQPKSPDVLFPSQTLFISTERGAWLIAVFSGGLSRQPDSLLHRKDTKQVWLRLFHPASFPK